MSRGARGGDANARRREDGDANRARNSRNSRYQDNASEPERPRSRGIFEIHAPGSGQSHGIWDADNGSWLSARGHR